MNIHKTGKTSWSLFWLVYLVCLELSFVITVTNLPTIRNTTSSSISSTNFQNLVVNFTRSIVNETQKLASTPGAQTAMCNGNVIQNEVFSTNVSCFSPQDPLQCYHDPIYCEKYFASGKRDLDEDRPQYGEYSSLEHSKWVRVIQHGGIAFLFHPCTSDEEKENLRQVATECLHRYTLSPYAKLTNDTPIALVSWGCFYLSSTVNSTDMKTWIRENAYKGPASHVTTNGNYKRNLLRSAEVLTDNTDQILCPSYEQKNQFTVKPATINRVEHDPESIIKNRLQTVLHKRDKIDIPANITLKKVEKGSAVWAAGSLLFLCGIMIGLLLYTRMWSNEPKDYSYMKVGGLDSGEEFEYDPGYSQFSLLKSSQKFMSIFRTKDEKEHKLDSMSRMNLMVPINEEEEEEDEDDDETLFKR